jgi:4-amino-4-deoxy-L-arabinose transferase-like glycosyltransferase
MILCWLNCVLGSLTAACYFLFARRAFHSTLVAALAGLFAALHPFWIINTAELNDGVLVSFLLSVCLLSGTRGVQQGGAFTGVLFGLALAALVMVRAALLPFATVAILTFLWQCRRLALGWFVGFLALVGFVNGIVPWSLRNFSAFEQPVPVADSTYLHLWMGNNARANGATLDEDALRASLPKERLAKLLEEKNQAVRYHQLAPDVWREVREHPTETIRRRIQAALVFLLGERWFQHGTMAGHHEPSATIATAPEWFATNVEALLQGTLLSLLLLAFLGWRWSAPWRRHGRLAAIAVVWIPLPYILSHAEHLAGPRLPLDGVLLCFAAFAVVSLVPGLVQAPSPTKDDAPR